LKIYPLYLLTNWCILVAKIGALLIAIFGALLLTDYMMSILDCFEAFGG